MFLCHIYNGVLPLYFNPVLTCSIDVICKYCFGYCNNLLSEPEFHPDTIVNLEEGLKMGPLLKHNYWMMSLLEALPESLSAWIAPAYGGFVKEKKVEYVILSP
jgi:hypothetical protein